jgi:hypothetical protein
MAAKQKRVLFCRVCGYVLPRREAGEEPSEPSQGKSAEEGKTK